MPRTQRTAFPGAWLHAAKRLAVILIGTSLAATGTPPVPQVFAELPAYSEGPVFDDSGHLYVSHGKDSVAKISPSGAITPWFTTDKPNGHKILPDDSHLLCTHGAVLKITADGKSWDILSDSCDGEPLRAPNDLTLDGHGGIYFSDPGGSRAAPIGTVHYIDADGHTHLVAAGLSVPNGLVLNATGEYLYLAETVPNRILRFPVLASGKLGPSSVFADLPSRPDTQAEPDGLLIDEAGRLYVAHLGMGEVQVYDETGQHLLSLPAGNYDASNLALDPKNPHLLYITGSIGHRSNTPGRVYRIDLSKVTWPE